MENAATFFITVSLPEQFLMAVFAWLILGRTGKVRFRNIIILGITSAVLFMLIKTFIPGLISVLPQAIVFTALLCVLYRLNLIETIIGSLMTLLIFGAIQGTVINTVLLVSGWSERDFSQNIYLRIASAALYFMIMTLICYAFYKANINIGYLKRKSKDKLYISRTRFLVLQLTFGYLNLFIIYTLFFNNINMPDSILNKALVLLCLLLNIVFTVILIKSVFRMGDVIQKEEELKRKYDGREILQNVNYISSLIDLKEYDEVKKFLESMKGDVSDKLVGNEDCANRIKH